MTSIKIDTLRRKYNSECLLEVKAALVRNNHPEKEDYSKKIDNILSRSKNREMNIRAIMEAKEIVEEVKDYLKTDEVLNLESIVSKLPILLFSSNENIVYFYWVDEYGAVMYQYGMQTAPISILKRLVK